MILELTKEQELKLTDIVKTINNHRTFKPVKESDLMALAIDKFLAEVEELEEEDLIYKLMEVL